MTLIGDLALTPKTMRKSDGNKFDSAEFAIDVPTTTLAGEPASTLIRVLSFNKAHMELVDQGFFKQQFVHTPAVILAVTA